MSKTIYRLLTRTRFPTFVFSLHATTFSRTTIDQRLAFLPVVHPIITATEYYTTRSNALVTVRSQRSKTILFQQWQGVIIHTPNYKYYLFVKKCTYDCYDSKMFCFRAVDRLLPCVRDVIKTFIGRRIHRDNSSGLLLYGRCSVTHKPHTRTNPSRLFFFSLSSLFVTGFCTFFLQKSDSTTKRCSVLRKQI